MKYANIVKGTFLSRPNRFLARVLLDGSEIVCHVKNTGRLRELLQPGRQVLLEFHPDAGKQGRKTAFSLVGAYKPSALGQEREILINIDSQAPNRIAWEWLLNGKIPGVSGVRREVFYKNSRFDLAFMRGEAPAFMEVKGVTLEENGTALFPDAPTKRGVKHLEELSLAVKDGYDAYVLFVIQMEGIREFSPNRKTHPEFAQALCAAQAAGVHVMACACNVERKEDALEVWAGGQVPVRLG